jgi:hypothetical protein
MASMKIIQIKGNTSLIIFFILTGIYFLFITSCEKEETSDFVKVAEVASSHIGADLDATYIFSVLHKAIYDTAIIRTDTTIIDSAWVYRSTNVPSVEATYLFDYADSTNSPDFKMKSGQIEAVLDIPWTEPNATMEASFSNFRINNLRLEGTVKYINTGELEGGSFKLLLESDISFYKDEQLVLDYSGNKTIYWAEGYDQAADFEIQTFEISGTSNGSYNNPENINIPEAEIVMEIDGVLDVSFDCHKIVKYGNLLITETIPGFNELLTGDFIDADLDGCSDKVMIKNEQNFGFPYYF